ncbi:MAG: ABC transporter substrate-binding protein [Burkholderiaceae bacterium]
MRHASSASRLASIRHVIRHAIRHRAALLLLGLAGIGSAGAQAPGNEIRIGVLNDQSGVYSAATGAGSVIAAKMAVEDAGNVLGRPVQVLVADHQFKPDVGASIARRWYDEGVTAIFDLYHSGVGLVVQDIAKSKNRIVMAEINSMLFTDEQCSPNGFSWGTDGYSLATIVSKGVSQGEPTTWYFITVDYTAGHSTEQEARKVIEAGGSKVLGSVRFPAGAADFSSFILSAQSSKAKNIGFIGGGTDTLNIAKQAREFGLAQMGQKFVPFSLGTIDVPAMGMEVAQGLPVAFSYYWGLSPQAEAWKERFKKASGGKLPSDQQADVYSEVFHYLKAVKAAGTTDTNAVLAKMRELPVEDFFTQGAKIRADGRLMRNMYYGVIKAPASMKNPDDLMEVVKTFSGEEAFLPAAQSKCPLLVRKK